MPEFTVAPGFAAAGIWTRQQLVELRLKHPVEPTSLQLLLVVGLLAVVERYDFKNASKQHSFAKFL